MQRSTNAFTWHRRVSHTVSKAQGPFTLESFTKGVSTLSLLALGFLLLPANASFAQDDKDTESASEKKALEHEDYDKWKSLRGTNLSNDGTVALYSVSPREGDTSVIVKMLETGQEFTITRGSNARITFDATHVTYLVPPSKEELDKAKEEKTKPDEMPKSKFECLNLASGVTFSIDRVRSYQTPEEGAGWVAILLEKPIEDSNAKETEKGTETEASEGEPKTRPPRPKASETQEASAKESGEGGEDEDKEEKKKNPGTVLVVRNLETGFEVRYPNVVSYRFSKDGARLIWSASSETPEEDGVFVLNFPNAMPTQIISGLGNYTSLSMDETGRQLVFMTDRDDYETKKSQQSIYHWQYGKTEATKIMDSSTRGMPEGWEIARLSGFSKNGRRVLLNTRLRVEEEEDEDEKKDDDEKEVKVDIWHWKDSQLQPMQLLRAGSERNRSFLAMYDIASKSFRQLADEEVPTVQIGDENNSDVAVGTSDIPYRMLSSWESPGYYDVYLIDLKTGVREKVLEKVQSFASLSPKARYLTWWDTTSLSLMGMSTSRREPVNLTAKMPYPVHNELHDSPSPARAYGTAGWVENDRNILIYDAHDIWELDPTGRREPRCVTEEFGRQNDLRFRYVRTDPEARSIKPDEAMLLSTFHRTTKASGFHQDQVSGDKPPQELAMMDEAIRFSGKAKDADVVLVTRSTFEKYSDAWTTTMAFDDMKQLSDANPQQKDYLWGSAELVDWTSLDGEKLQGILYKPEGFDASKKYPMIVYFYERNSDGLHRYVSPAPARASINYSFYVSRGYLVFVPDIPYRIGHPGQSCLNAVIPGVTSLIETGFVDQDAIGVQGHSWGGYQIAYLVTKCHIFAAAEAGAPVSNMTSAYGGIRWASGMSRMFQYEKTQSRIGGTLWDSQQKYIENSPVFWADQVQTPLLMLHNDEDGAVPWYQGIEMFVALRRLSKPTWMFNYNGEGHGLGQEQNQKDWSIRLQQYFDHYLKGAPAPRWLAEGVPATEKGKTLGLELMEEASEEE